MQKGGRKRRPGRDAQYGPVLSHRHRGRRNEELAFEWFRKAAEKGEVRAQYNLGVCYYEGRGTARDYAKAIEWYRRASAQGAEKAQRNLAYMLAKGEGTSIDLVEAYKWLSIADRLGEPKAAHDRNVAARKMSAEQIAQARKAADAWKPTFEMDYFD